MVSRSDQALRDIFVFVLLLRFNKRYGLNWVLNNLITCSFSPESLQHKLKQSIVSSFTKSLNCRRQLSLITIIKHCVQTRRIISSTPILQLNVPDCKSICHCLFGRASQFLYNLISVFAIIETNWSFPLGN